jgi:putative peptide zinc metalloprotease protein
VSGHHARIRPAGTRVLLEDSGSTYGTFVDGERVDGPVPLRDGSTIALGDTEVRVERRRGDAEAGRTIVVPAAATVTVLNAAAPRLRTGYALKRLDAREGERRWVLNDQRGGRFLRLTDADAALLERVDGTRSLAELIGDAERRLGPTGPARLARLLADLADRGLVSGVDGATAPPPRASFLLRPRVKTFAGAGDWFATLYREGGWALLSPPALGALAVLALVGAGVFAYLVAGRYGTPFVVASKVGLGGLVFLVGRLGVTALHELAHGLVMASYGRRVRSAGVKLLLVFPYLFVDTSEAWFEPRRRRVAISAAGPASDFTLGGLFSVLCLVRPPGALRDIFFQLAFAAYLGGIMNLNPFLDRDGYYVLVDVLREPGLRRRAREQFTRRLSGRPAPGDSRMLARYSVFALAWSVVAALFAIGMTWRYRPVLAALAPADAAQHRGRAGIALDVPREVAGVRDLHLAAAEVLVPRDRPEPPRPGKEPAQVAQPPEAAVVHGVDLREQHRRAVAAVQLAQARREPRDRVALLAAEVDHRRADRSDVAPPRPVHAHAA